MKVLEEGKTCSCCKEYQHKLDFNKNKSFSDGLEHYCRVCAKKHKDKRHQEQGEEIRLKKRLYHLKYSYGIELTEEAYALLLEAIPECPICEEEWEGTPHLDHCHKTNKLRGLLCRRCNTLLGHAKDSVKTLQKAIDYLNKGDNL